MDTQTEQGGQAPMLATPGEEHRWLQQLVGEWTSEARMTMEAGAEEVCAGRESVRSLGGLWILAEGQGEMPGGGQATMLMTLGYDPGRKRYVGTWVGSMMTHMWIYEGELDAGGRVLTLASEGPDMSPGAPPGRLLKYRDVIEIVAPDHRVLTSHCQGADGQWQKFMEAHYRRKG